MNKTIIFSALAAIVLIAAACGDDEPGYKRFKAQPVDLGLSVKWADLNIGATEPQDWGGLYGWGDSTGLHEARIDEYPIEISWSQVDGREVTTVAWKSPYFGGRWPLADIAGTDYDIAAFMWNTNWRLPTKSEWNELIDRCQWTVATDVQGARTTVVRVTGPNGNSILLPMTGIDTNGAEERGNVGHYWTSNLLPLDEQSTHGFRCAVPCAAWSVTITPAAGAARCNFEPQVRNFQLAVRPVYAK